MLCDLFHCQPDFIKFKIWELVDRLLSVVIRMTAVLVDNVKVELIYLLKSEIFTSVFQ